MLSKLTVARADYGWKPELANSDRNTEDHQDERADSDHPEIFGAEATLIAKAVRRFDR